MVQGLRKDLGALRKSVVVSLAPRFDAIEERMDALSTRDDMAEIGRQISALRDQLEAGIQSMAAASASSRRRCASLWHAWTRRASSSPTSRGVQTEPSAQWPCRT